MNLSEIVPTESTFYLRLPDRSFMLNPITLRDEIWIEKTFENGIEEVFETLNIKDISRLAYQLMSNEDKEYLGRKEVTFRNEDGEEITETIGGVDFLMTLVSGTQEKESIIIALLENIGISRRVIDAIDEADKKKVKSQEKQKQLNGL